MYSQERTSRVHRQPRYCSIACRPLRVCLRLEIWGRRCSAQNSAFEYASSFAIPQINLSLFSCNLSFPVTLEEKSGFYARPSLFSGSSQDFISSLFDFSH